MAVGWQFSALGWLLLAACARPSTSIVPAAPPADSGYVSAPGAQIFYKSFGTGDPIVVVHGGPGMDHAYLLPGMRRLAESNRAVFYDQRGGGRTQGDVDRFTVSFDIFLSDITALADSLRLGRFVLLGHSWGGLPALRYSARHPDRVSALVLMNTVEPGRKYTAQSGALLMKKRTPADSAEYMRIVRSDAMRRRDTSAVNGILRATFRTLFTDRTLADQLAINLDQRTVSNMGAVASLVMGSVPVFDFWTEAATITVPTLIVQGADDAMPLEMVRELARAIPGAELRIIEGAGHFPYIEKPGETFAAIQDFLRRSTRR